MRAKRVISIVGCHAEGEVGDVIGFRGPYGNGYPMDVWKGRDLIFLGGGIAMPPIRCAAQAW